jgi:predicted N-acetyltransferase YhbS
MRRVSFPAPTSIEKQAMSISTIAIGRLKAEHLPQAHALSQAVGWPHRLEDWALVLKLGRGFAALSDGELIGTIIWWPFGERHATLGMVVVAPAMQGQGLGRRLMQTALEDAGSRTALLNATAEGLPLYEKLGFRAIGAVRQHQAAGALPATAAAPQGTRLRRLAAADREAVVALDARAAGFGRAGMLNALAELGQTLGLERDGHLVGFAVFRRFGRGYVIGPVVAEEADGAKALIADWIAGHRSDFLRIDVTGSSGLSPWLEGRGLPQVGDVITMVRGDAPVTPEAPRLFAVANQALG